MAKLMPFDELLDLIENDPIAGAQEAQKRNNGVRVTTYQSSISAGALYRQLKSSPALTSGFYGLPFWQNDGSKKAYTKNPKHLNKHCHQFVLGACEGSEGKRGEDHAFATQEYLDDEKKSLTDLLEALKRVGFDGLRKAAPAQRERNKARGMESERLRSGAPNDMEQTTNAKARDASPYQTENSGGREPSKKSPPRMSMKEVFEHLLVKMKADQLRLFLPDESDVGDRYLIEVERVSDSNSMAVWQAADITDLSA